jgi:hypothetical protein
VRFGERTTLTGPEPPSKSQAIQSGSDASHPGAALDGRREDGGAGAGRPAEIFLEMGREMAHPGPRRKAKGSEGALTSFPIWNRRLTLKRRDNKDRRIWVGRRFRMEVTDRRRDSCSGRLAKCVTSTLVTSPLTNRQPIFRAHCRIPITPELGGRNELTRYVKAEILR